MSYAYPFDKVIRDPYQLELFLYDNGFTNIFSIDSGTSGGVIINYTTSLNESELAELTDLVMNTYPNPYPSDKSNGAVSLVNSTNSNLNAYAVFNGTYEDVSNYTSVSILINSDCSTIQDGIELYFSTDGISDDYVKKYTYTKNVTFVEILSTVAKYFKIVYKNGGNTQTKFTLQSIYHATRQPNIHSTTQENLVVIQEQDSVRKTAGRFRTQGFSVVALANQNTTHDFIFKYDISPLVIKFKTAEAHKNDLINLYIAPNVTVGVIVQNATSGNNYFYITPASFDWLSVGCLCRLTNGVVTQDLGDVIDIDYSTGKVTVETNLSNSFSVGSYVQMSVQVIREHKISEPGEYSIGDSKIGASFIPKGQIIRLVYTNVSNTDKTFIWTTEMLY